MRRFLSIGEVSKILGVSVGTLRRWEKEGRIASVTTSGGHRRFDSSLLQKDEPKTSTDERLTVCYARVSSHDQAEDLKRQKEVLELYAAARGWTFEIISDLGSGMNDSKKGLCRLINLILDGRISRLVITHKDRLLRFGAELVFSICESKSVEVVIINKGDECSYEEDLAKDVLEIITVFSARLYGRRSHKNKKLIESVHKAVLESQK